MTVQVSRAQNLNSFLSLWKQCNQCFDGSVTVQRLLTVVSIRLLLDQSSTDALDDFRLASADLSEQSLSISSAWMEESRRFLVAIRSLIPYFDLNLVGLGNYCAGFQFFWTEGFLRLGQVEKLSSMELLTVLTMMLHWASCNERYLLKLFLSKWPLMYFQKS